MDLLSGVSHWERGEESPSTLPPVGGLLPHQPSGNCQAHFQSSGKSCNLWQDLGCLYSPFPGGLLFNYAQAG